MKICQTCQFEGEINLFKGSICKVCEKEYKKQWYQKNKLKILESGKIYYNDNKIIKLEYQNNYRKNNLDKIKEKKQKYKLRRRIVDKIRYDKNKIDKKSKLRESVSNLINKALKKNGSSKKGLSCLKFLQYSMNDLRSYLENQFESWMNWNNWGKYDVKTWNDNDSSTWTWNIDHITPQSKLPYISMEEENFKKCWSLDNLRPYSAKQNIIDGNRR